MAGFLGTALEQGKPTFIYIRLKVEEGRIAEADAAVSRFRRDAIEVKLANFISPDPLLAQTVPVSRRVDRDEMVRIASQYARGVNGRRGDIVPFDPKCDRRENGARFTNNPAYKRPHPLAMGCTEQFNAGTPVSYMVLPETYWRFPIVDEERGLVLGKFLFVSDGKTGKIDTPFGGRVEIVPALPGHNLAIELFKIVDGKILRVEILAGPPFPYGFAPEAAAW
jgi:hypothetical protein